MDDLIITNSAGQVRAQGSVASRLLAAHFNIGEMRTNDVLQKDEWVLYDDTVVQVARIRMVGVLDLMNAGLTFPVKNALGITRIEWQNVSDMDPAIISMSGVTRGRNDRVEYDLTGVPLPISHKDFTLNIRALEASRNRGEALDTTQASIAATLVAEAQERMLFNGANVQMQGSKVYGYTTAPNRITGSLLVNWGLAGTTGIQVLTDILAMFAAAAAKNHHGPFVLYIPPGFEAKMDADYATTYPRSIRERLLAMPKLSAIKVSDVLAANNVVLVELDRRTVDLAVGQEPTTVQWDTDGGMQVNFKIMSIMVPRIKTDFAGNGGLVHYVFP